MCSRRPFYNKDCVGAIYDVDIFGSIGAVAVEHHPRWLLV